MGELSYQERLFPCQNQQRNENLEEFSNALTLYLQCGITNQLMQNLVDAESLIAGRHSELREIAKNILRDQYDHFEEMQKKIFSCMEEEAYLGQLQRIISMYNIEFKKREEKKRFQDYAKRRNSLFKIVEALAEMTKEEPTVKELKEQCGISSQKLYGTIRMYPEFFEEDEKNEKTTVSLSRKGHRYYEYVSKPEVRELTVCQEINYRNCVSIMKALEDFAQSGAVVPRALKLVDLSFGQEKALRQKYRILTKEINSVKQKNRTIYNVIGVINNYNMPQSGYRLEIGWIKNEGNRI